MNRPAEDLRPVDIERELLRLSALLDDRLGELATRSREAAEAEAEYRVEKAKALIATEGAMALREAHATVKVGHLLFRRNVTEQVAESTREACRALRAQLSAVQSIGANLRAVAEHAR